MTYDADIRYHADGKFRAELRDSLVAVASVNAEHDLCNEMVKAGLPDGSIQFWRGSVPSVSFVSVHRAAKWRVDTGEHSPWRIVRRQTAPNFKNS